MPRYKCCVVGCTLRCHKKFTFPKDPVLVRKWKKLCGRPSNFDLEPCYKVCEEHFPEEARHKLECRLLNNEKCKCRVNYDFLPSLHLPAASQKLADKERNREDRIKKREKLKLTKELLSMSSENYSIEKMLPYNPTPAKKARRSKYDTDNNKIDMNITPLSILTEVGIVKYVPINSILGDKSLPDDGIIADVQEREEDLEMFSESENEAGPSGSQSVKLENCSKEPAISMEDLCRVCGKSSDERLPVFSAEGRLRELQHKISVFLPIIVTETDLLPLTVCHSCVAQLDASHELYKISLQTETMLKHMHEEQKLLQGQEPEKIVVKVEVPDFMYSESSWHNDVCNNSTININDNDATMTDDSSNDATDNEDPFNESTTKPNNFQSVTTNLVNTTSINLNSSENNTEAIKDCYVNINVVDRIPNSNENIAGSSNENVIKIEKIEDMSCSEVICEYCNQFFLNKKECDEHKIEKHKFSCPQCKYFVVDKDNQKVYDHYEEIHKVTRFVIPPPPKQVKQRRKRINRKQVFKVKKDIRTSNFNTEFTQINENYKCNHCKKLYKTRNSYKNHRCVFNEPYQIQAQNNDAYLEPLKCTVCKSEFLRKVILKDHYFHKHDIYACLIKNCSVQSESFEEVSEHCMKVHLQKYIPSSIVCCEHCGKKYKYANQLERHIRYFHEKQLGSHVCTICDRHFQCNFRLREHMAKHTGQRDILCDICGKGFYFKKELYIHILCHLKIFTCTHCDKNCSSMVSLSNHIDRIHTSTWIYHCNICDVGFGNFDDTNVHFNMHSDEERNKIHISQQFYRTSQHQCKLCSRYFKNKSVLLSHAYETHKTTEKQYRAVDMPSSDALLYDKEYISYEKTNERNEKKLYDVYQCMICNKICATVAGFQAHYCAHVANGDYELHDMNSYLVKKASTQNNSLVKNDLFCNICKKVFKTKIWLEKHVLEFHSETNDDNFRCNYCNETFIDILELSFHKKTHTHRYECPDCNIIFRNKKVLRRHYNGTHNSDRQEACEICGKKVKHSKYLKQHMKTHEVEKLFMCQICDRSFRSEVDLTRHSVIHV